MKNNKKKVLIIKGSPHKNGDTSYILKEIKGKINGEIEEVIYKDLSVTLSIKKRFRKN